MAILELTLKEASTFGSRLRAGAIISPFETIFLDPTDMFFAERIRNVNPYVIDWLNIPDYMNKTSLIKFARACPVEDTIDTLHFMNWTHYVHGSCHVRWADHHEECKQHSCAYKWKIIGSKKREIWRRGDLNMSKAKNLSTL